MNSFTFDKKGYLFNPSLLKELFGFVLHEERKIFHCLFEIVELVIALGDQINGEIIIWIVYFETFLKCQDSFIELFVFHQDFPFVEVGLFESRK